MHAHQGLRLIQNWKVANSPEGFPATQRHINRLEKWGEMRNLMKFRKGYCKVLQVRNNNPMCKHVQANWSTVWQKRTLGFWVQQAVYEPVRHPHTAW